MKKKPNACGRTFLLPNHHKNHNTSLVAGARSTGLPNSSYGKRVFSGFVFRGDKRKPEIMFNQGFFPRMEFCSEVSVDTRMARLTGALDGGFTYGYGVSTTLSARIAMFYVLRNSRPTFCLDRFHWWYPYYKGYIYLIDARVMSGYAIPVPEEYRDSTILHHEWHDAGVLKQIYEVNFVHPIPNSSIVGVVWSNKHVKDEECEMSLDWLSDTNIQLTLGENTAYDGDMEEVTRLFQ